MARRWFPVLAGLLVALGSPAAAQGGMELTPLLGAYTSLTNVIELGDGTSASQSTALAVGVRASLAPERPLSAEAAITFTPSDVSASAGATGGASSLILVNARGVWNLGRPAAPARPYVAVGGALILRDGEFYEGFSGTTDVGGNVAAGLRVALGRVQGRVEVEGYLYSIDLAGSNVASLSTGSQFQADLVVSAAVAIPLGG